MQDVVFCVCVGVCVFVRSLKKKKKKFQALQNIWLPSNRSSSHSRAEVWSAVHDSTPQIQFQDGAGSVGGVRELENSLHLSCFVRQENFGSFGQKKKKKVQRSNSRGPTTGVFPVGLGVYPSPLRCTVEMVPVSGLPHFLKTFCIIFLH